MLPAAWAALVFVGTSAWLWAARAPGWVPDGDPSRYLLQAKSAAALACALAVVALTATKRPIGMTLLVLAACCLAWARAPLPRLPTSTDSKIVELQARIVRVESSQFGGCWGMVDQLHNLEGVPLASGSLRMYFRSGHHEYGDPIGRDRRVEAGNVVRIRGVLEATNLGYSLKKCVMAATSLHRPISWLQRGRQWVRHRLQSNLQPPHRAMALALLLGEKGELQSEQRLPYRRLGLLHLLAISGMHFWVWSAMFRRILPTSLAWIRLPILLGFAMLANFSAPVLRAFCAVLLRDGMAYRGRGIAPFTLWAIAAWAELVLTPHGETSLGFLLTYLATAALLWARPPRSAGRIRQVLQPSTAAFLGTMPTLHALQGTIEPWSIPFTPIFALMIPPRLIASLTACSNGFGQGCQALLEGIHHLEQSLFALTNTLPAAPYIATHLSNEVLTAATLLIMLIMGPLHVRFGRMLWRPLAVGASALALLPATSQPTVLSLPVGHGLATAIIGDRQTLLFDLGSAKLKPVSLVDRTLLPALNRSNARPELSMVFSHSDSDHTNGGGFLKRRIPYQSLDCRMGETIDLPQFKPFQVQLSRCWQATHSGGNEGGLVLDVRLNQKRAVILGDSYGYSLRRLCSQIPQGPVDLLIVPHHGLTTDGLSELLDHLQPAQCWASTDSNPQALPIWPLLNQRQIPLQTSRYSALFFPSNP